MFGSRIVNRVIYEQLMATPGLTAVVDDRIYRGLGYPQGAQLPAVLFYMEQSSYDAGQLAAAEHIDAETMRFVVRVEDIATTDDRIAPAAEAQLNALAGLIHITEDGNQATFTVMGEVPMTSYTDGDRTYQRLGTIYSVTVTRGG